MEDHHVQISEILLLKIDGDKPFFDNEQTKIIALNRTQAERESEQSKHHENVYEAKDATFMSDYNYTYFREKAKCLTWPTIHYVRLAREQLDRLLPQIQENIYGIFYKAIERISWILEIKLKTLKLPNKLKICLRGDKTLSGNQSFFNFCFSLPDEGNLAKTAFGQYSLGVFEVQKDDHETMDVALDELSDSMRNFKSYNSYSIDWHLSGDMVWMKTERGLNGCNSKNPCFLCEIPRDQFYKKNHEHML